MSEDCAGERDRSHVILLTIFIHEVPKRPMRKKEKMTRNFGRIKFSSSPLRRSQAKCHLKNSPKKARALIGLTSLYNSMETELRTSARC